MDRHEWLILVLRDLEVYAETNDLRWLSQELSQAKIAAISEIGGAVEDRSITLSRVQSRTRK
jgi:hypothetical protein